MGAVRPRRPAPRSWGTRIGILTHARWVTASPPWVPCRGECSGRPSGECGGHMIIAGEVRQAWLLRMRCPFRSCSGGLSSGPPVRSVGIRGDPTAPGGVTAALWRPDVGCRGFLGDAVGHQDERRACFPCGESRAIHRRLRLGGGAATYSAAGGGRRMQCHRCSPPSQPGKPPRASGAILSIGAAGVTARGRRRCRKPIGNPRGRSHRPVIRRSSRVGARRQELLPVGDGGDDRVERASGRRFHHGRYRCR